MLNSEFSSSLYFGRLVHKRFHPSVHEFEYDLMFWALNLDELESLDKLSLLFSSNSIGWFSFNETDHGDGSSSLKEFLDGCLRKAEVVIAEPRFVMLCFPRVCGFSFNPISIIYCYDKSELVSMIYEVNNTFSERIHYVIPVKRARFPLRQTCDKKMFVSPFFKAEGHYDFRVSSLGNKFSSVIDYRTESGLSFRASYYGFRKSFSPSTLRKALLRYPFHSYKIIAGIHFQALKLWLKGNSIETRSQSSESVVVGKNV